MTLLGNLKGSAHVFPEITFYNGVATQSLRFDEGSSSYLTRTPDSVGNRKTWTWSSWIKFSKVNHWTTLFASGSDNNNQTRLKFDDNGGRLFFDNESSGSSNQRFYSTRLFRDPSAWYNIVLAVDTTQATNTNRVKIYANGTQITAFAQSDYPAEDLVYNMNTTNAVEIGRQIGSSDYWDGYMADVNFIDGLQLTPSSFGEFKNGVWIPIDTSGLTFGTNGFKLKFDQTGVGTASTSTIGADTSGNTHHFTSSGIATSDCNMPDSPENNFPTLNSIYGNLSVTLSEGNLKYTTGNSTNPVTGTISIPTTGKWYWEVYVSAVGDAMIGVQNRPDQQANGYSGRKTAYYRQGGSGGGSGSIYIEGTGYGGDQASYTNGDVVSVLYNADDMQISWYVNGTQQGSTYTVTDTDVMPIVYQASSSGNTSGTFNFGQDSTFAGAISAGGNTDANGIGDFKYTVPSGYLALCTANLPKPTIGSDSATQADDHFNTVLYTGDGSGQSITGVGFQPDWTWIKSRSHASSHVLTDSSRGVTKSLFSDNSDAETTLSGGVTAFGTDGFTLGSEGTVNTSSRTYVGWNWKANGGTTSSNSDGTITSTVQANTTAGFSIVTYTGTGSNATVGHGLSTAPDVVLVKGRSNSTRFWNWWGTQFVNTSYIYLNTTGGEDTGGATITNSTYPSSTVFSIGTSVFVNGSSETYVAYCFHEVEGYSKMGSYTGNGSTDGTFVFTGFRPAWVLIKRTDTSGQDWMLVDSKRDTINPVDNTLFPSDSTQELDGDDKDFVSNGFKHRSTGASENASGGTYIYMAFAEAPFKYANAR